MKQLLELLTTSVVLAPSVPIESGAVLNWANVHQINFGANYLKKGDVLDIQMQCEVTNDSGINTGVDVQILLSEQQPIAGANVPSVGQAVEIIEPCTVDVTPDGGMHHFPFFPSGSIKLTEDWPTAFLTSRILAQSTAFASASGPLTIEGPAYGQLTVKVFR